MLERRGFIAAALAFGIVRVNTTAATAERAFAPHIVRADLDLIWQTLLRASVEPFRTSERRDVEQRYRSVRAAITRDLTAREVWLRFAYVLAALNDGHVGVGLPDALETIWRRFPLRFSLAADGLTPLVANDRTNAIPVGSRLLSIDGVTAANYSATVRRSFGAQTQALARSRFSYSGKVASIALLGDRPSYHVRYENGAGIHEASVAKMDRTAPAPGAGGEPYAYRRIGQDVAYIDYRSCEDLERFQRFLAATFAEIETRPTCALVIDIRENGGGDSSLNDALWSYITEKPFRQFGAAIYKSCDLIKRAYGKKAYVQSYGNEAWAAVDGKIFRSESAFVRPQRCPNRFKGPVYLLTSTRTFSSAMSCALAAKDYGLATIVGEETGEPANSTGEVFDVVCPGTGLHAYITTKVFLAPKHHPDRRGVVPDVRVEMTLADVAAHRDPVLERALELARFEPTRLERLKLFE